MTPTVDDIMSRSHIGNGFHQLPTYGGLLCLPAAELRQALEDAYDPLMPNWPSMVELES